MGSFYTSLTVRGPDQQQLLDWLERPAFVSVTENGITSIFDEACDSQDLDELSALGERLSAHFGCPALSLMNHDDSVLLLMLHEGGTTTDRYISDPDYFGEDGDGSTSTPQGGDAARIAAAFGVPEGPVAAALHQIDTVLAVQRHEALASALGWPDYSIAVGYTYLDAGEYPEGTGEDSYAHT